MLVDIEGEESLREEVRYTMQQGVRGAGVDQLRWAMQRAGMDGNAIRQTLSQFDDTAGGVFTHDGTQGEMIELIRAKEVFSRAGVSEITLPPNGRLPFPKQTSASSGYWVGENQAVTESEPGTGAFELLAKKLACLIKCPNELIRFGTPSVEAFFRSDMARVLALKADRTLLDGVGATTSPKGLINFDGVNTYVASTVATDGNTFEPEDVNLMLSVVEELDHDLDTAAWKWIMRPKMWTNIQNRRAGSGYGDDDHKGAWLFPINRSDIAAGRASMLAGHPVLRSTQVSGVRTKGSSSDLSYILGGVFAHYLLGRIGVLEITTTTQGDTAFANDQTWLKAIQHLDGAPRYPNAFVFCDSSAMDLPAV
jgi:HK97 family phage major capsid protein